jgi:hypothetical protein
MHAFDLLHVHMKKDVVPGPIGSKGEARVPAATPRVPTSSALQV